MKVGGYLWMVERLHLLYVPIQQTQEPWIHLRLAADSAGQSEVSHLSLILLDFVRKPIDVIYGRRPIRAFLLRLSV